MIRSTKKAAQVLLAVAAGFVVSFGATQAVPGAQQVPLDISCNDYCVPQCVEAGFAYGFCQAGRVCACYN
ncbi:hypothetical protein JRI60_14045 [Archangium violaceum]|uniref:hypothetical protein n=1 Tax=Archangium TaxID=47 RepID=UPI00194E9011|nr:MULTISPECIES: hypothetical protein [Archangium]QRO00058.1 hypothetical protein JRI60_14045 [Archangium violaceum]